ncbi:MAG TPA: PRC-barrel domain-containing protein [Segeticoccus sp.]|uniref:PRC-barrel domain-containing protein n=1 Tax=Segeticoccus sp. TaxID=2706531 RepID=UPI002D805F96|nr:PRC-barrel domain-containing protein [Segeticoccus sp.]HET8601833.1 PRC-barrel domain-containing protein [Segeticoccus sp.]
MFEAENIADWRGRDVVDKGGAKVGTLEALYFDTARDVPTFATVKSGFLGRHKLIFVPLADAVVSPDYLKVAEEKDTIKKAPSMEVDGALSVEDEPAIFEHYGLVYERGSGGERRLARR